MKIAMLGTGIYSLSIALNIKNEYEIVMWSEDINKVEELKNTGFLNSIINDVRIPNNIRITNDYEDALKDCNYIFIGTNNKYVRNVCESIKAFYNDDIPIIILTKGMDSNSNQFMSELIKDILNPSNIAVLSGPTFAKDLINKDLSGITLSSNSDGLNDIVKDIIGSDSFIVQSNLELIGSQICGSYKNMIAILSGMIYEITKSKSAQCFLLTVAFNELRDILDYFNCDCDTIISLAGFGDYVLTCTSTESRNYTFGELFVRDNSEAFKYLDSTTVEGFETIKPFKCFLEKNNYKNNIIYTLYDVMFNNGDFNDIISYIKKK